MPYPRQCPARRGGPGRQEKMTCRGHLPRLHQDLPGTAAARPGPRTLAADRQPADPPPRDLQLRRRDTDRRHHLQTVPAALCRLGQPVAVRDLPRQPRRLRRIGLLHRPAPRHLPRRPRHRLRPLPQRPHRLDPTPDELTGETTKASALWNLAYDAGYGAGPAVFGLICACTGYPAAFALTGALILAALRPPSASARPWPALHGRRDHVSSPAAPGCGRPGPRAQAPDAQQAGAQSPTTTTCLSRRAAAPTGRCVSRTRSAPSRSCPPWDLPFPHARQALLTGRHARDPHGNRLSDGAVPASPPCGST